MSEPRGEWIAELRRIAVEFCHSVVLIKGPADIRPWNTDQVVWAGDQGPAPSDDVFAYRSLGSATDHVALLGERSRSCFSLFVETFREESGFGEAYGVEFLRDMLVGLLELSLPGATLEPVPSPYWKRYVAPAAAELKAGSPQRYAEAVTSAIRELPRPHPPTVVILPLAGVTALGPRSLAGARLMPATSCAGDPELSGCAMLWRRIKELQQGRAEASLIFGKVAVPAEPGLAVERAARWVEQVCRLLRLLPNPGPADGPLSDPPRIDLDAGDSAAFYIGQLSVGTHPIPVRRTTSDPQGRVNNWRVEPRLSEPAWQRLGAIIEAGASCDLEARLLAGLRHLGDAQAEPSAGVAAFMAMRALEAMLAPAEVSEAAGQEVIADLAAGLTTDTADERREQRDACMRLWRLGQQLAHDLERPVTPAQRAEAIWIAFRAFHALLAREDLRGHADLVASVRARSS